MRPPLRREDAAKGAQHGARYLGAIDLPESLQYTSSLAEAAARRLWLIVTPSHAFRDLLEESALRAAHPDGVAWATKGFEPGSGRFLHEVAASLLPVGTPLAVVTGPSFAREVASYLHGPAFRAYTGSDMIGAELGGAMKNVLAVATGVADGMQLGLNARAGMITRGLNEMLRVCVAIGGKPETIMGLAGVGDLVLTCTGDLSRNRRLGLALGRGVGLQQAVREIGQVVESVQTVNEVMRIARRHRIELPITEQVQRVLAEEITPQEGLKCLLAREQKPEYPEYLFR